MTQTDKNTDTNTGTDKDTITKTKTQTQAQLTVVAAAPGKHLVLIGDCQHMGGTTGHLQTMWAKTSPNNIIIIDNVYLKYAHSIQLQALTSAIKMVIQHNYIITKL